jgi:hypothetical protein
VYFIQITLVIDGCCVDRNYKKYVEHISDDVPLQVTELKFVARQSATLNNQFKKGMKHLAMCKRKKCSVCAYTKATFGEYAERSNE